jgi:hypothetical protein
MTTPQPMPTADTAPIYRSRKEAREARLAAAAWETTMSTPVESSTESSVSVGEQVIDDLAPGIIVSRTARRAYREAQEREALEARKSGRRSRYKTFPRAASLSLMIFLSGFVAWDHAVTPSAHASEIIAASTTVTPEPVAPAITPVVATPAETPKPVPATPVAPVVTEPPVSAKVPYGQVIGTLSVSTFGEEHPRDLLEGGSKIAQMNPIVDALDAFSRHVTARYPSTAQFGAKGVVGIAGHRGVGELSPFTRIHEMRAGDTVSIDTAEGTYTYAMLWQQDNIDPHAPGANRILVDPVYRTSEKTGDPVVRALVITTCGLFANGDGDESVRVATYFEYKSFTPKV